MFDQRFDSALLSLVSDFLSRMEQLFPVPDFKQVKAQSLGCDFLLRLRFSSDELLLLCPEGCLLARGHPCWSGGLRAGGRRTGSDRAAESPQLPPGKCHDYRYPGTEPPQWTKNHKQITKCNHFFFFSSVGSSSEEIFLSAWSHPLVHKLTNPDLPPCEVQPSADVQHLDVELVKVEVEMTMDEEQEHLEEIVIGPSSADNEESNQRSAADSIESSLSR